MECSTGLCMGGCICREERQDSNLKPASEDTSLTTPPSAPSFNDNK
jgi:hypothetical protein